MVILAITPRLILVLLSVIYAFGEIKLDSDEDMEDNDEACPGG
jgi:hypothetical protein